MNRSFTVALGCIPVAIRRPAAAALFLGLVACGTNSPTGTTPAEPTAPAAPTAGWLTLQLATPRSDDGAVQLLISGPEIDSIRVVGYPSGFATVTGATANLVVTGQVSSGTVGQIYVPDVSLTGQYQSTIVAAAARNTYLLQDLTGYRALLVR